MTSHKTLRHANILVRPAPGSSTLGRTRTTVPAFRLRWRFQRADWWRQRWGSMAARRRGTAGGRKRGSGWTMGARILGARIQKRNCALYYSPSYFHRSLNQRLFWCRTLKISVVIAFEGFSIVSDGLLTCYNLVPPRFYIPNTKQFKKLSARCTISLCTIEQGKTLPVKTWFGASKSSLVKCIPVSKMQLLKLTYDRHIVLCVLCS